MSDVTPTTLRRELLIEQGIDEQLDTLVRLATAVVLKLSPTTQMEESQLRNLLNASIEKKSVEVTANFIRYQIARKERDWDTSLQGFGHTIIQHIVKDIKGIADDVVKSVVDRLSKSLKVKSSEATTDESSLFRQEEVDADIAWIKGRISYIHVRLMQLYLGYINRAFYFYKKSIDRDKREPQSNALKDALTSLQLVSASTPTEGKSNGN